MTFDSEEQKRDAVGLFSLINLNGSAPAGDLLRFAMLKHAMESAEVAATPLLAPIGDTGGGAR